MSGFSDRLKKLQNEHSLLKKDVALAVGISTVAYYYIETERKRPSTDTIIKLARFFNVSTDYLLGLSRDPTIHDPVTDEEAAALEQPI
ncbi:MAG: helix-turn-helix domain-containing protein [Clostridiales bacterium]|jgi:DNA-binding XRE family transcriptional regulator|nr:helix-turn-helix domain-containing protein [Clostridiales bacterium]